MRFNEVENINNLKKTGRIHVATSNTTPSNSEEKKNIYFKLASSSIKIKRY